MTRSEEWTWPVVALVAASFLVVWLLLMGHADKSKKKYKLPPGPPKLPIIGNLHQLIHATKLPHHITVELAEIYGPIMSMKLGVMNRVFVSSPELAMEILKVQDHVFADRPTTAHLGVKRYMIHGDVDLILGVSGEYNSFIRRLMVTELLSQKRLQGFQAIRTEEQDSIIREAFEACSSARPVDIRNLLTTFTMNVITRMIFSRKFFGLGARNKKYQEWKVLIPEVFDLFPAFLFEDMIPALKWLDYFTGTRRRMQSSFHRMDSLLQKMVEEHRDHLDSLSAAELDAYDPKDFMDVVLCLNKKEKEKKWISDTGIRALAAVRLSSIRMDCLTLLCLYESKDAIFGAFETNTSAMEWVLSELIANPEMLKKAQDEIDSVVGKDRPVHESDAGQLRYLAAVIKETFRLHNTVPWLLPRSTRVDCKVGGYDIPAESVVHVQVYGMSRDASFWKNPLKFDPERFLTGKHVNLDMKGSDPHLLPFGAGRRNCPGMKMTNIQLPTTLARLLQSFDWALPSGAKLDMSEKFGGTITKNIPLEVNLKPRLPIHLYKL